MTGENHAALRAACEDISAMVQRWALGVASWEDLCAAIVDEHGELGREIVGVMTAVRGVTVSHG